METVQHELTLDVLNPRKNIIHVVQDDSRRTVKLNLLKDGLPFNIREDSESGIIGIVAFRKPDGHSGEYDTLSDGVTDAVEEYRTTPQTPVVPSSWLVHLEGQVTACAWWTLLTVKFYKTDGQLIQTFPITLDVAKSATPLNEPSEDYYNVKSIADALAVVASVADDIFDIKDDISNLESKRVVRVYRLNRPTGANSWQAYLTNIYPSAGISVGDYIITNDLVLARVSERYSTYVQLVYVQTLSGGGGGGGSGEPGRDAVIWSTVSLPTSGYIAISSLFGPIGATPAAGDMIVGNYQGGTVWFVTGADSDVAFIDTDHVFNIKGDTGTNGSDGADGANAVIWYTTSTPTARLPGESGGYISTSSLSGPSGETPSAGHMIVSNSSSAKTVYFISSIVNDQAWLQIYSVDIKGNSGTTFTPAVNSAGVISWTNDGGETNPSSVDLVAAVLAALPTWTGGAY